MPLDINAFRAIANQNPDKFVYAQGDVLKTTKNEAHHEAHTYLAATSAFLKACGEHYGSRMGKAFVEFLQADIVGGKPLTARKIKALVAFADEKMGSAKKIDVGGKAVELEKIGTDKMSRVGRERAAKIANAQDGQRTSAAATLAAFKFGADGKVDLDAMLRHLNTFHAYIDREIAAIGIMGDVHTATKLFEQGLFMAVDAMDNNELSAVYQGLISKQTDGFKKELARIINHPDAKLSVKAAAERAFGDISRIEAMIVSEISRRMILDQTPDDKKADVPSLMKRYVGEGANPANHYDGARDMSTVNLVIMANKAAKGSNDSKTMNEKTDAVLKSHGMGAVDSKKIGDMLRAQELTINMKFAALMGYSRTGDKKPSLFKRQDAHLINTFESKELQNKDVEGTAQLRHRNQVEKCFFPEYGTKPLKGRDRPVYGALNTPKLTTGAADTSAGIYGRVVVVLRPHVKQNCTYTLDDSFWATRISLPADKREEMEETLISAFSSKLKDPAAALAELQDRGSEIHGDADRFYSSFGDGSKNIGAHNIDAFTQKLKMFLNSHLREGVPPLEDGDLYAHFVKHHAIESVAQAKVAGYDNIENLLAQEADFTALSMGVATLRNQENPKAPFGVTGCSYIEAQFHGPVLLDRDVEEIRIDTTEMHEHFEDMFDNLPVEERAGLDKNEWVDARLQEAIAEIKADTKNAPFKVVFYDSEATHDEEGTRLNQALAAQNVEAVGHLKDDLVAAATVFRGERFGEVKECVLRYMASSAPDHYDPIKAVVGEKLEKMPDWIREAAEAAMDAVVKRIGTDATIFSADRVRDKLGRAINDLLALLNDALKAMDKVGCDDPAKREALMKEIARLKPKGSLESFVHVHLVGEKALADVNAFVRETFEKDIEGGADFFKRAFAGHAPVSGIAERNVIQRIQDEIREIKAEIAAGRIRGENMTPERIAERLRKKAVQPYMERRARIMAARVHMKFPSDKEHDAFLGWATSAGKLKTDAEFLGVYEGSTKLAAALEKKIKSNAPLSAQDLVDVFKAFIGTAVDYMEEDAKGRSEYGPDDRMNFVGRIVSVTLSRLDVRLGRDALAKIAAALDTPDARWLHTAILTGDPDHKGVTPDMFRAGTFETAGAFFTSLHQRLSNKFDLPTHQTNPSSQVTYAIVPPAIRALVAQINPAQAQQLAEEYPYDPANSGARRLKGIPAPANPDALPQNMAARKAFLVDRMLPIYHEHEKGFDYGTNWHGRTHATRSFVFSIAMGNILREKGVKVDMNAVSLATAGHDTGRESNGRDTAASEKRSADTVVAAVNKAYPNAAGPAWSAQVSANITTKTAEQETIEGYLFKCADSLDYSRIDDLDEKHFPFLKGPIATDEGLVLLADAGLRRQLMKEAKLLSQLTSPTAARNDDIKGLQVQILALDESNAPQNEIEAVQKLKEKAENEVRAQERNQTDTLTNQQVVDLVENAIRSRPQDFPLLTKYYLNAE